MTKYRFETTSAGQSSEPPGKQGLPVRIDRHVLDFIKFQRAGYQMRINAVLRSYMEASHRRIQRRTS